MWWSKNRSRLLELGLIVVAFTIPISQFFSIRLLVLIIALSFFTTDFFPSFSRWLRNSWDVILYLAVLLVGLIYSVQLGMGVRVLETSFSLLGFSFLLANIPSISKERFYQIMISFSLGVIVSCIICFTNAIIHFRVEMATIVFFFDHFTDIINIQPTYFAYYLCFVITFGMYFLYYEKIKTRYELLIMMSSLFLLFIALMLTGARTAYVGMLLVFSFFILKFLFEDDRIFLKKWVFALSVLFLIAMLAVNHYDLNVAMVGAEGDYWERLSLWKSAIAANSDFLLGVGTGDYKMVMNEYYLTHNLSQFASDSFNAHNQFLQTFFSNGLIGFVTMAILIGRPLYLSVKYRNVLGILVFFSFLIYGMTEVFLGRYQGVVFFALLHQVFIHFYYSSQSSFSLKGI